MNPGNVSLILIVFGIVCFAVAAWRSNQPEFNKLIAVGLMFGLASRIAW